MNDWPGTSLITYQAGEAAIVEPFTLTDLYSLSPDVVGGCGPVLIEFYDDAVN